MMSKSNAAIIHGKDFLFLIKLDTNKQLLLTFFAKTSMNVSWPFKLDDGNSTFAPPKLLDLFTG